MSAIWGCIDLSGRPIESDLLENMREPLDEYSIDRFAMRHADCVAMGCGIQYIHQESEFEPLPIFDDEKGLYFTADCIVDNRDELTNVLCPDRADVPDGELLFLAWGKWGHDTPKHVFGSYSFALFDKSAGQLVLCADHLCSRSIYYCRDGNRIYFSTLVEPVLRGRGGKPELNETWVAIFLSMTTLSILANPVDTPYVGISRVCASHYMCFEKEDTRSVEYWSPKQVKPLRLSDDAEYRTSFRTIMATAASQMARTAGNVGMLLSSGFDSTAVAAFAAKALESDEKTLHAYTYIPVSTYDPHNKSPFVVFNEQAGTEAFCRMYPNIRPGFFPVPEQNAITPTKRIFHTAEIPYKSLTNMAWINAFAELAAKDGCKVMLTGQMGNSTISAGTFFTYEMTRLLQARLIDAAINLHRYARLHRVSRKWVLGRLLVQLRPRFLSRLAYKDFFSNSLVNRDFAARMGIVKRDSRIEQNVGYFHPMTFRHENAVVFNPTVFAHVSDSETKIYLKHGLVTRDPTRDIRVWEFRLGAPMKCFVKSASQTRQLIRSYLKDMLPPEIISPTSPQGVQSGDWSERLKPNWVEHYAELERVCRSPRLNAFVDRSLLDTVLEKFRDPPNTEDHVDFLQLGAVYQIGLLLEGQEWT